MSLHGWLYAEDSEGNPQEIINHARTYAYLKNVGINGLALTAFDEDVDCPAVGLNPRRKHPGLALLEEAEFWFDPRYTASTKSSLLNLGTAGPAYAAHGIDGAEANHPVFLDHDGLNYFAMARQSMAIVVPASDGVAAFNSGDFFFRFKMALFDYSTVTSGTHVFAGVPGSWTLGIRYASATSRRLRFSYSTDGSTFTDIDFDAHVDESNWFEFTEYLIVRDTASNALVLYTSYDNGVTFEREDTQTLSGATAFFASGNDLYVGDSGSWSFTQGFKIHNIAFGKTFTRTNIVVAGGTVIEFAGSPMIDVSAAKAQTGNETSLLLDNNIVATINRLNVGQETVASVVVRPTVVFGSRPSGTTSNTYLQIDNNPYMKLGLDQSYTAAIIHRHWPTTPTNPTSLLAGKIANATPSYILKEDGDNLLLEDGDDLVSEYDEHSLAIYNDGATNVVRVIRQNDVGTTTYLSASSYDFGAIEVTAVVRDSPTSQMRVYADTEYATIHTESPVMPLDTDGPFVIGGNSTLQNTFEFFGFAFWQRALTSAELALVDEYINTVPLADIQTWEPYTFAAPATGDNAPWYDGTAAAAEALGVWVEEWTGLDGSHHVRTSTSRGERPGGASFSPIAQRERVMKINVLLFAQTEAGLRHLFRWLESTLLNACDYRSTGNMWIREICPAGTDPEDGLVRMRGVALIEGPTMEADPIPNARCQIRRVSFTLAVGDPCLYGMPSALGVDECSFDNDEFARPQRPAFNFVLPNELSTPAPLSGPTWLRGASPKAFAPSKSWATVAPIVTISSDTAIESTGNVSTTTISPLRRSYLPPLSVLISSFNERDVHVSYDGDAALDPIANGQLLARIDLNGIPSGSTLIVDFAAREVLFRDRNVTDEFVDGWRYVADRGLFTSRWTVPSSINCEGDAYVVVRPTFSKLLAEEESGSGFPYAAYLPSGNVYPYANQWTVSYEVVERWGCV